MKSLKNLRIIGCKNPFLIVVPKSSTFEHNSILLEQIKIIQNADLKLKIGIFFQTVTTMVDLQTHFLWFRNQLVGNVFATGYLHSSGGSLNIFTFHSFGKFEVINVTKAKSCTEFFPSLDSNYHQHNFRVASFDGDLYERFWLTVFEAMNATFTVDNTRYRSFFEYFLNGFDIYPRFFSYTMRSRRFRVYPLTMTHENIVVPEAEPYSGIYTYFQTLTSNELFAYCGGVLVAMVSILIVCRYVKTKKILFFQSLWDVLNLLANDNSFIKYQRLSRAETFLIGPLTFVGFVVVNGYLSNLQSYVTKPVLQPQLTTISDIYNSPLKITAPPHLAQMVQETVTNRSNRLPNEDWSKKIVSVDRKNFHQQILEVNTSTAYAMSGLDFGLLSRVQRRLKVRSFYDTGVTVTSSLSMFFMNDSFLFMEKFNEIIHLTHSSGLFNQWVKESFAGNEKKIVAYHLNKLRNQQATDDEFEFPLLVVYGWIVSILVLIVEIMWSKISKLTVKLSSGILTTLLCNCTTKLRQK